MSDNSIFPRGPQAPSQYFTGLVWFNMLHADSEGEFHTQVLSVEFEPSARTFWHSHPGGQILLATSGTGYYQEKGKLARKLSKGDMVTIPANVLHWHGAAPNNSFVHIALNTRFNEGPTNWKEEVSDEQYKRAAGNA